jgi:hypothetical protein
MPLPAVGIVLAPIITRGAIAVAKKGALVVFKGIVYLVKACNVVGAGYDIHSTINNDELTSQEKTHRVATSALFLVAQTMDVGVDLARNVSSSVKMRARVGVGIADVSRKTSQKAVQDEFDFHDGLEVTATAAFRAADIASLAVNLYPQQFGDWQYPADLLQAGAILTANQHTLISAKTSVGNLLSRRRSPDQNSSSPLSVDEKYRREVLEVLQANEIGEFNTIPELFLEDEGLKQWVCPITKKSIRYISVIQTTIESIRPVWYEKSAITAWITKNPQQRPPQWPGKISLRERKLIDYTYAQKEIDQRLLDLFNEMRELADIGTFTFLDQAA